MQFKLRSSDGPQISLMAASCASSLRLPSDGQQLQHISPFCNTGSMTVRCQCGVSHQGRKADRHSRTPPLHYRPGKVDFRLIASAEVIGFHDEQLLYTLVLWVAPALATWLNKYPEICFRANLAFRSLEKLLTVLHLYIVVSCAFDISFTAANSRCQNNYLISNMAMSHSNGFGGRTVTL